MKSILYPYIKFSIGTLYPAYRSWKALKRKDETNRRRWMKYWVSFAAFQLFELISDYTLAFILPFYLELKITCLLWIVMGTKLIFDSIVNRELTKREKAIDKWLTRFSKARNEMVALVWFELSRCSVKLITMLMSVGMSAILIDETTAKTKNGDTCNQASAIKEESSETEQEDDNNNQEDKMDITEIIEEKSYKRDRAISIN